MVADQRGCVRADQLMVCRGTSEDILWHIDGCVVADQRCVKADQLVC